MILPDVERAGSFTSFLFQDIRCKCFGSDTKGNQPAFAQRHQLSSGAISNRTMHKTEIKTQRAFETIDAVVAFGLESGEVIDGTYKLIEMIGQGGMGLVFLSEHLKLKRTCALKVLAPSAFSETSWMLFQNEAKIVAGLNHPGICQIYDLGIHKERLPFYAMEYLPGETLEELLMKQGTISIGAALEVFIPLTEALAYAHKNGVVHKDIKPANIMLVPTQKNIEVRLLDFGIAELNAPNIHAVKFDQAIGTALYMSPERFDVGGSVSNKTQSSDPRSDIYSIGCSIFETLAGSLPFEGTSVDEIARRHKSAPVPTLQERTGTNFPTAIEAVIKKCLAKESDDRYQSAEDLHKDLVAVMQKQPLVFAQKELQELPPQTDSTSAEPVAAKKKSYVLPLIACLVLAIAGGAYAILNIKDEPQAPRPSAEQLMQEESAEIKETVDVGLSTYKSQVERHLGKRRDDPLVWHFTATHPRLGQCKAMLLDGSQPIPSFKFYKGSVANEVINEIPAGSGNYRILRARYNDNFLPQAQVRNAQLFKNLKVKRIGKEQVGGLDCTRYSFAAGKRKGTFWTTAQFGLKSELENAVAASCETPRGYGLPVRFIEDGQAEPAYGIFLTDKYNTPVKYFAGDRNMPTNGTLKP